MVDLEPKYDIIIKCNDNKKLLNLDKSIFGKVSYYKNNEIKAMAKMCISPNGKNDIILIRMQNDSLYFPAFTFIYGLDDKHSDSNADISVDIKCKEEKDALRVVKFMHTQFDNLLIDYNSITINHTKNMIMLFIDGKLNIQPLITFIPDADYHI